MPSRDTESLESRIFRRRFRDREVVDALDGMALDAVIRDLGTPVVREWYAEPKVWRVGDGRPALADDDPAVMQAIGRCAAGRSGIWGSDDDLRRALRAIGEATHPRRCGWCDYPLDELLLACDWATWQSRFLLTESLTWSNDMGQTYVRSGRSDAYQNPAWARFWGQPRDIRQAAIRAAQYPTEAAA